MYIQRIIIFLLEKILNRMEVLNINLCIEENRLKAIRLKEEVERRNKLRGKIISILNTKFTIPDYVIEDIIDAEDYGHICLMINMATLNNKISKNDAEELKSMIRQKFEIKNMYDRISII